MTNAKRHKPNSVMTSEALVDIQLSLSVSTKNHEQYLFLKTKWCKLQTGAARYIFLSI